MDDRSYILPHQHLPGGSASAGVMKGLQAVLVFVVTSVSFCGRIGGNEMCFSTSKLASLVIVCSGVVLFGKTTAALGADGRRARGGKVETV